MQQTQKRAYSVSVGIKEAFPKVVTFYLSIEDGVGTSWGEGNGNPLQYSSGESCGQRSL